IRDWMVQVTKNAPNQVDIFLEDWNVQSASDTGGRSYLLDTIHGMVDCMRQRKCDSIPARVHWTDIRFIESLKRHIYKVQLKMASVLFELSYVSADMWENALERAKGIEQDAAEVCYL